MKTSNPKNEPNEVPILSIIQRIKDKKLDPKILSKDEQRRCVEALMMEGYSEPQIAQVLSRSQKTIKRNLEQIRENNSINPNPELTKKLIGAMLIKTEIHHSYLMRLARKAEASISEKSQAEYMAWRVVKESTELLQSLGYLPLRPKEIVGDIFHHQENSSESISETKHQIEQIETLASEFGISNDVKLRLNQLKEDLKKIEISEELKKIENSTKEVTQNDSEN